MRIYLIRHGETQLNKEFRFIGRTDPALSEQGKAQARALAERLAVENISAIYVSDLLRATQTASIIAGDSGVDVVETEGLREIDFGNWEGLSYNEIMEHDKEILDSWIENPTGVDIPGGESWRHFESRINDAFDDIMRNEHGHAIALVTHGGPIKLLMTRFHGGDPHFFKLFWPQPGGVNIVEIDDKTINIIELSGIR
ncbi:MAG: histidine phosphatase family protein [Actinomycetota bacterium]|nr:histidine phosphatase family protein [Actinomycetota bacterium]